MGFEFAALGREVHFWTSRIDGFDPGLDSAGAMLPADERATAERMRAPRRRSQFVLGRVMLRTLLRRYVDESTAARPFRYLPEGKPVLDGVNAPLHFSLAHSGGLVVAALSAASPLGVDVEKLRPMPHLAAIADGYFTAAERAWLASNAEAHRAEAFLRLWTCREALTKVEGQGISAAWHRFELTVNRDASVGVAELACVAPVLAAHGVLTGTHPGAPGHWSVVQPEVAPGYVAALAVRGPAPAVQTFEFELEHTFR